MDYLLTIQNQMLSQKKELGKGSMKNLIASLLNLESSTTFTEATVIMETSSWILNSYAGKFQGPSCSSRTMATTSTLSTTAVIPTTHVDVLSSISSQNNKSIEDMLEESFTVGNSRSTTGSISQSKCRKIQGCTYTSIWPGEHYNFPLMECVDKRILLWNEAILEASATEPLKMLFDGDTVSAKVKLCNDAVIMRTPVIVLSNNDVFHMVLLLDHARLYKLTYHSSPQQ